MHDHRQSQLIMQLIFLSGDLWPVAAQATG
jgi:hypothetical protein